ncbi:MAG: non-canonical purine pyrophosphatase [Gammaproteobacteria bacterium]|jgi:XTP/dITP diphosphohydrolase|nr:non-canonical purine pyrophosphatase [Gammaproteobacteria bacterium]
MQRIILATNNLGKTAEFQQLLMPFNWQVIPQTEFNLASVEETGLTFIENAIIKARYAAEKTGLAALADDSGLEVDALNGAPGIYSARYAGEQVDFLANCQKLLTELTNTPFEQRTARFHCVLAYLKHPEDPAPVVCHGSWEGIILTEMRGTHGFGYDPLFYVPSHGCSAAELDPAVKNGISHRAKAFATLVQQLKTQ